MDEIAKIKVEHEISRIEKSLRDVKPLSYSSELKWNEMEPLVNGLEEIWKIVRTDFETFIENN